MPPRWLAAVLLLCAGVEGNSLRGLAGTDRPRNPHLGQFIPQGTATAEKNKTQGSFKPKFPVHCRPIDFDQWKQFQAGSEESNVRCARLYNDAKLQPEGLSGVSESTCKDSYSGYKAWSVTPGNEGVIRMFCNVAAMNLDTEMVKNRHYLDTKLVSSALTTDHDIKMQFERWYDETNLKLLAQWEEGGAGGAEDKAPTVSDDCANAYGNFMCSSLLPNCTYMPWARWPYHTMKEKIYVCKETCEEAKKQCGENLPHPLRCDDLISKSKDEAVDPTWSLTAYDRNEAGGHACSSVKMTVKFKAGADKRAPASLFAVLLALAVTWVARGEVCA